MKHALSSPSSNRLRDVLESCGYRCDKPQVVAARQTRAGTELVIEFGDKVTASRNGHKIVHTRMTVRTDSGIPSRTATRWHVTKSFCAPHRADRCDLDVDIDFSIGDTMHGAHAVWHGHYVFQSLSTVLADARETTQERLHAPLVGRESGPGVRITISALGDLVLGRSGLIPAEAFQGESADFALTLAACDQLKNSVLPELGRVLLSIFRGEIASPDTEAMRLIATDRAPTVAAASLPVEASKPCPSLALIPSLSSES